MVEPIDRSQYRALGRSELRVSPIAFGAFKIGRNERTKYPQPYDLPGEADVARLLDGILEMGINYIDTAPAYGCSEERLGRILNQRRQQIVLGSKVGEQFTDGKSHYDFSRKALLASIEASLGRLRTEVLDILLLHSDGRDVWLQRETEAIAVLQNCKQRGLVRAIGLSGKTVEGAFEALAWADLLMVQYHLEDRSHEALIAEAHRRQIGVVVKKGLASGHLPAQAAIGFLAANAGIASIVVGGLNLRHFEANIAAVHSPTVGPR